MVIRSQCLFQIHRIVLIVCPHGSPESLKISALALYTMLCSGILHRNILLKIPDLKNQKVFVYTKLMVRQKTDRIE